MQANYQVALLTPAPDNQGWPPRCGAAEVTQPATLSPLALDYPRGPFGPEEAAIRAPVHAFPAEPSIPWPSVLCHAASRLPVWPSRKEFDVSPNFSNVLA